MPPLSRHMILQRGWVRPPLVGSFYLDGRLYAHKVIDPRDESSRLEEGHINFEILTPAGTIILGSFHNDRARSFKSVYKKVLAAGHFHPTEPRYWGRPADMTALGESRVATKIGVDPTDAHFAWTPWRVFADFGNRYAVVMRPVNEPTLIEVAFPGRTLAFAAPALLLPNEQHARLRMHLMFLTHSSGPVVLPLVDEWIDASAFFVSLTNRARLSAQLLGRHIVDRVIERKRVSAAHAIAAAHYALEIGGLERRKVELLRERLESEAHRIGADNLPEFDLLLGGLDVALGAPEAMATAAAALSKHADLASAPLFTATLAVAEKLNAWIQRERELEKTQRRVLGQYLSRLRLAIGATAFFQATFSKESVFALTTRVPSNEIARITTDGLLKPAGISFEYFRGRAKARHGHTPRAPWWTDLTGELRDEVIEEIAARKVILAARIFKNEPLTASNLPRKREIDPERRIKRGKIDFSWKDIGTLMQYISDSGKIIPRRYTRLSARNQSRMAKHVKIARNLGLLPSRA